MNTSYTLDNAEADIKSKLANGSFTIEDLKLIIDQLCGDIEKDNKEIFKRFDFWLQQEDKSSKIVCANIEFVKFGLLISRPSRVENSGVSTPLRFTHPKDLRICLDNNCVRSAKVLRRKDTTNKYASLIDEWVNTSITAGVDQPMIAQDIIQEESNQGNNRVTNMRYISVNDLIDCIAKSGNAKELKVYATRVSAVFCMYLHESQLAQSRKQAQQISELTTRNQSLEERIEQMMKSFDERTNTIIQQNITANKKLDKTLTKLSDTERNLLSAITHLDTKSELATKKPSDDNKRHVVCLLKKASCHSRNNVLRLVCGQVNKYVKNALVRYVDNGHYYKVFDPIAIASGIDFRNNFVDLLKAECAKHGTTIAGADIEIERNVEYSFDDNEFITLKTFVRLVRSLIANTKQNPMRRA